MSLGWSYNSFACLTGFEAQSALTPPFNTALPGSAGTSLTPDIVTFNSGVASLLLSCLSSTEDTRYHANIVVGGAGEECGAVTVAMKYVSGLASGHTCNVFSHFGQLSLDGLGWFNDGGSVKISYNKDATNTSNVKSSALSGFAAGVNGWYYAQMKRRRTGALTYTVHMRIFSAAGALLEDLGNVACTNSSADWSGHNSPCIGIFQTNGDAVIGNIDDICVAQGTWTPNYLKVIQQKPNSAEGANTAWTLGLGVTEWGAVADIPNDGDTTYIERLATSGVQDYNLTASGITLAGAEKILGAQVQVLARNTSGTGSVIGGVTYAGVLYEHTSNSLTTTYKYALATTTLPAPAAGWLVSDLDAGVIRVRRAGGSSANARCSQMLVEVAYGVEYYDYPARFHPVEQPQIEKTDVVMTS